VCMYISLCIYVIMHICMDVCMYVYVCTHVCMYVCIYGQVFCGFITHILLACTLLLKFEYYEPDLSRES